MKIRNERVACPLCGETLMPHALAWHMRDDCPNRGQVPCKPTLAEKEPNSVIVLYSTEILNAYPDQDRKCDRCSEQKGLCIVPYTNHGKLYLCSDCINALRKRDAGDNTWIQFVQGGAPQ